jgi:hypothetical protein
MIKSNLAIPRYFDDPSKILPGLNDHSSAGVDYLQSASIRIDELPMHMVQTRPTQTNQTLIARRIVQSPSNPHCGCDHHHFIRGRQSSMRQNSGHCLELSNYFPIDCIPSLPIAPYVQLDSLAHSPAQKLISLDKDAEL